MARRKLPKNFDAKIKQQLLQSSGSKQEFQNQVKELVKEYQADAEAVAIIKQQRAVTRKEMKSQATQFSRQASAPSASFEQREAALSQFQGVESFATSPQRKKIAEIHENIGRAQLLKRNITSKSLSDEYRMEQIREFEQYTKFAPQISQEQVAVSRQKLLERSFQGQVREASLVADPAQRKEAIQGAISKFEGSLDPRSGSMIGAQKNIQRAESEQQKLERQQLANRQKEGRESFQKQMRQAELIQDPSTRAEAIQDAVAQNREAVEPGSRFALEAGKKITRARGQQAKIADEENAGQIRERIQEGRGTPTEKLDVLNTLQQREQGEKTLKEIEKLTREQNQLIQKDVRNFEEAQKNFPILSRVMGGGDGNLPPGQMSDEQAGRIQRVGNFLQGARDTAATATLAANEFMRSGVRAEERTFLNIASAQSARAQQNYDLLTDMSGKGLLRSYGDILLNPNESRFTGVTGIDRARSSAANFVEQTRAQETRDALLTGGAGIAGGTATTVAGVMMGNPLMVAGGIGAIGAGASSVFNNRAVRGSGVFDFLDDGRRRREAESSYMQEREQASQRLTDADISRNLFQQRGLDAAIQLRETEMGAVTALGGDAVSFRGGLAERFRNNQRRGTQIQRNTGLIGFQEDVANTARPQGGLLDAAAGLGLDVNALTENATRAGLATDSRFGGDETSLAMNLRRLEISGRGSMEQLTGNVQALNRASGSADPGKQLENIFSRAVASGFKNARISQEFASAVVDGMQRLQTVDEQSVGRQLGAVSNLTGGGERGLGFARSSFGSLANLGQNELVRDLSRVSILQGTGGIGDTRMQAAATDTLMRMNLPQQLESLRQVEKAFKGDLDPERLDPESRTVFDLFGESGRGAGMARDVRERLTDAATGGRMKEFQNAFKDAIKDVRAESGGELDASGVTRALNLSAAAAGTDILKGADASTRMLLSLPMIQGLDGFSDVKDIVNKEVENQATDKQAMRKFGELNRLREKEIRSRNAFAAGGESRLTETLFDRIGGTDNLFGRNGRMNSVAERAQAAGVDLQQYGDFGTGLGKGLVSDMLKDRDTSRQIMTAAGTLARGGEIQEGRFSPAVQQIAEAIAEQSRLDVMDMAEGRRLGIDQVSMVSVMPSSVDAIGESVAKAIHGTDTNNILGRPGVGR